MPDIYQFIKYNSAFSIESFRKKSESGAVICFDLEDSIFNWIDENATRSLKEEYRAVLKQILLKLDAESIAIKTGIRLNSCDSGLQDLDLDSIPQGIKIHSILIPKVENRNHIDDVAGKLKTRNIIFEELLPIIETKLGMSNLDEIVNARYKVTKVGFGHCDYNLSIGAFPFFHQDTIEYWKWVTRITDILRARKLKFINSAYLSLDDSAFFQLMISYLQLLCGDNFGQFTLSYKQTLLCSSEIKQIGLNSAIAKNRLDLGTNIKVLSDLVTTFEKNNKGQGFTIKPENGILISPQEYCSAKMKLRYRKHQDVNLTFVGGCFPVQGDILFEDLFHQTLKKKLEADLYLNLNVNIIRYEKFGNCLEKIASYSDKNPIDYLVFHIRPEPYLRLIKLYYKYLNYDQKLCRSLNLPFLRILKPEKYDLLLLAGRYNYFEANSKPKLYNALVNLNYFAGYLIGNQNYALNEYLRLADNVIEYCEGRKIKLIILGPALRANAIFETLFSRKLEKFMSTSLIGRNAKYVLGMKEHQENDKKYFRNNGIHATELYHDLIAERLFDEIKTSIIIG